MAPVRPDVVLLADAGDRAGLGHLARSSALAAALSREGLAVEALGHRLPEPTERAGVAWRPVGALPEVAPPRPGGALVLDSYEIDAADVRARLTEATLVVIEDLGRSCEPADLVVAAGERPSTDPRRLTGPEHACLTPPYWDLVPREVRPEVRTALVTTGAGDTADAGALGARVAAALPGVEVTAVRGPQASWAPPAGVRLLDAPEGLRDAFLASDLAVCAAGQTMLEALATGTPCVAIPVAENQRLQAESLAARGAVRLADEREPRELEALLEELAADHGAWAELSRRGREAVDGRGALRVAERIVALLR